MNARIAKLPALIANQIAAGEVIERPASVVKELLENALDAKATQVHIELIYGGLNFIKISDNGCGIFKDDLPLAITAHATSKIKELNDLYAIESMGFRGEALASIASIAKVIIASKPHNQDLAMQISAQNGQFQQTVCARNTGTTIEVIDLFFNAPVRKRFLKSEKLEFQAVEAVVKRFALSAPHIAITLEHNNKKIFSLPAANTSQAELTRLTRMLGAPFAKEAIYLDVERANMRLFGWISGPNIQRSQNDKQWVYINQRMVKDKLILHALKQAYEGFLHPGRFPACVLYLELAPSLVDVNVHPTKHEVRFQEPRMVHDFFCSQLKDALQVHQPKLIPSFVHQDKKVRSDVFQVDHTVCSSSPAETPKRDFPQVNGAWMLLNPGYVLTVLENLPCLVDLHALYQYWLKKELSQWPLPWNSRPLLVPLSYVLPTHFNQAALHASLEQMGIQLVFRQEEVLLQSIPLALPYFNVSIFWEKLCLLSALSFEALSDLILEAQVFDPRLFSMEEKKEFQALLLTVYKEVPHLPGVFKVLMAEDCRNLLNV